MVKGCLPAEKYCGLLRLRGGAVMRSSMPAVCAARLTLPTREFMRSRRWRRWLGLLCAPAAASLAAGADAFSSHYRAMPPDLRRDNNLLLCAAEGGNAAGAEKLLLRLQDRVPLRMRRMMFNTAIKACIIDGELARALRHFKAMLQLGIVPNDRTFGKLMVVAKVAGKHEIIGKLFKKMLDMGIKPSTFEFNGVLDALACDGQLEEAESWYARFLEAGMAPDAQTYHYMICCAAKRDNYTRAQHWYQEGVRFGVDISSSSYAVLSSVAQTAGDADASRRWFEAGMGATSDPLAQDLAQLNPVAKRRRVAGSAPARDRARRPVGGLDSDAEKRAAATDAGFSALAAALRASADSPAGVNQRRE